MSGTSYGKLLRLYFQSFNYFPQVVEEVRPCQFLLNKQQAAVSLSTIYWWPPC